MFNRMKRGSLFPPEEHTYARYPFYFYEPRGEGEGGRVSMADLFDACERGVKCARDLDCIAAD